MKWSAWTEPTTWPHAAEATDTMPSFLRGISEHQPITPVIETVRGLLTGTPIGDRGWVALGWAVGILLVAFAGSTWLYRHRTRG